jgi:hypothetical protein
MKTLNDFFRIHNKNKCFKMSNHDEDYRLYIEEKFTGLSKLINARFENVDDRLERIEEQTKKTNGRVNYLEEKEYTHYTTCPNSVKIDSIYKELDEYRFILKYPKLFVGAIVIIVILTLSTFVRSFDLFTKKEPPKTEINVQK